MQNLKNSACFMPAFSHMYLNALQNLSQKSRALPNGITMQNLNPFNASSGFVYTPQILVSPGQFMGKSAAGYTLLKQAAMNGTVLGDSMGFQLIAKPHLYTGPPFAVNVLHWQEANTHVSPICDIPSRIVYEPGTPFKTVTQCRDVTLQNGQAMIAARTSSSKMLLLNVIQGNSEAEFIDWYHNLRLLPLEGYAFGGAHRLNIGMLLRVILDLRDSRKLADVQWFHVFGTCKLEAALALTILKRAVDDLAGRSIPFTFDASTPFTSSSVHAQIYTGVVHTSKKIHLHAARIGCNPIYAGKPFPFPSTMSHVARRVTLGDINVKRNTFQTGWDTISQLLLANHNLEALMMATDRAISFLDYESEDAAEFLPKQILNLKTIVDAILTSKAPLSVLKRYQSDLNWMVHSKYR